MHRASVVTSVGSSARLHRLVAPLAVGMLLAGCAGAAVKPVSKPVSLEQLLRIKPQTTSVTLLPGAPPHLTSLDFVNAQVGWAGGQGVILATSDGGESWGRQYLGAGNVTGFSFLSPKLGYAASSSGLLKTTDGTTWSRVDRQSLYQVQFVNSAEGFALEGQSYPLLHKLLATSDGGGSWRPLAIGPVAQACFYGADTGIATLPNSFGGTLEVERTTDGGANWDTVLSVKGPTPEQLQCTPDGGAWLVATSQASMSQQSYTVFRSADQGASWKPVIAVSTAGSGPAPGNTAGVAKGPGSSPGPLSALSATTATMAGTCEACNEGNVAFSSTTDGGSTWTSSTAAIPLQTAAPFTLDMVTAKDGWLLSSPGTGGGQSEIRKTTNGGASWRTVLHVVPAAPQLFTAFVTTRIGFGLGTSGDLVALLKTLDGGTSWQPAGLLPQATNPPTGFAAAQGGRLFVVDDGAVYVGTQGGSRWSLAHTAAGSSSTNAISFATSKTGCATSGYGQGEIDYATRDGGTTWRRAELQGVPAAVCAVSLKDPALAQVAIQLIRRLASKTLQSQGYYVSTVASGGESLWIALSGYPNGRLYVLAPGKPTHVTAWPDNQINIAGLTPIGPSEAFITTYDGRVLVTHDTGRLWKQIS